MKPNLLSDSKKAVLFAILITLGVHYLYYPKWSKDGTEATISWDITGYYLYLPAIFIYKDLKQLHFKDEMLKKYHPSPNFGHAFLHKKSGNYVIKYSLGQAVSFLPGFTVGHIWASNSNKYEADGFSLPYQFCISFFSLLCAIIGFIVLRLILLKYFDELTVAFTIISLLLGSNYLNYTAIDGAMTHNSIFTIYALLIYLSIKYHKVAKLRTAVSIGFLIGLVALIRPTELISCMIPLLWGTDIFRRQAIRNRVSFLVKQYKQLISAVIVSLAVGSLQLIYWKHVGGEWLIYSYEEQGFSWLRPHIREGIFSYKNGWLVYSPFMIFSLIGFFFLLKKNRKIFATIFGFTVLFIYIAFAWDIWWYGGSLGQRTMVQCYAILAFPLAALFASLIKSNLWMKLIVGPIMLLLIYVSLWFTHQAHEGGLFYTAQMTKPYYWNTLLTYEKNPENLKLLDHVDALYEGKRENIQVISYDSTFITLLDKETKFSKEFLVAADRMPADYEWLRVSAECKIGEKIWDTRKMTHFIVEFKNGKELLDHQTFRIQHHMNENETKRMHVDIQKPTLPYKEILVRFYNPGAQNPIEISKVSLETYDED